MKKQFYLIKYLIIALILFLFISCNNANKDKMHADSETSGQAIQSEEVNNTDMNSYPVETDPQIQSSTPEQTDPESSQPLQPKSSEEPDPTSTDIEFYKLAPTIKMSFAELVGDNGDYSVPNVYPEAGTFKLVVNVYYQFITAYIKDIKGDYTIPVRYMICSTGSTKYPSPTGIFKMKEKRFRFSKFETFNVYGQYWSQITGNIFFHSVLYSKKDAKTYISSSYNNLGKRVSHGCIRLLVPDARWIYYNIAPGTVIEINKGTKDSQLAAIKEKLTRAKLPSKRLNLIKGEIPVTEPWPGYTEPT